MPLGFPTYRDTPTKWGGVVRIFPSGQSQVLVRDFGLTTQPECSEEAHAQIDAWRREHHPEFYLSPIPFVLAQSE